MDVSPPYLTLSARSFKLAMSRKTWSAGGICQDQLKPWSGLSGSWVDGSRRMVMAERVMAIERVVAEW